MQVKARQTLLDIALQQYGGIDVLFDLANENDLGITDDLFAGEELLLVDEQPVSQANFQYYQQNKIYPASGLTESQQAAVGKGIGFMQIETDFKIS